jgi:hypothetical protein
MLTIQKSLQKFLSHAKVGGDRYVQNLFKGLINFGVSNFKVIFIFL